MTNAQVSESIALEREQAMHISDIAQVLLPPGFLADSFLPSVDELEDSGHHWTREWRRSFRKASHELIEEFFGRDLKVEGISAGLDEGIEKRQGQDGDMWIAMVCQSGDGHRCFSRATNGI